MNYEMRGEGWRYEELAIVEDEQALALELHALLQKMGNHADLYSSSASFCSHRRNSLWPGVSGYSNAGDWTDWKQQEGCVKDTHAYLVFWRTTILPLYLRAMRWMLSLLAENRYRKETENCQLWISWKHQAYLLSVHRWRAAQSYMRMLLFGGDAHYGFVITVKGIFSHEGQLPKVCAELSATFSTAIAATVWIWIISMHCWTAVCWIMRNAFR